MNDITTASTPPMGLVPASMSEAMRLADMMAGSKLVPLGLQNAPADCLMIIQQAIRWNMDPFAVAQECAIIKGRLMHSGKLVAAVVNARGNLAERLSYAYADTGTNRSITVSGRLRGEDIKRTVTVRYVDARTSAEVWKTQPDQQLMYHGARVWARRHTPELMLGIYAPEEFGHDVPDGGFDPTTGEILRQNPHVTQAEDIVEVPTSEDPDRIPTPKEAVPELPKMQQREVGDKLGKELAALKTIADVENWKNLESTSYRAWQLREMWRETLQGRVKEKLMELRGAAAQAAFEHEQDAQELARAEGYEDDETR